MKKNKAYLKKKQLQLQKINCTNVFDSIFGIWNNQKGNVDEGIKALRKSYRL